MNQKVIETDLIIDSFSNFGKKLSEIELDQTMELVDRSFKSLQGLLDNIKDEEDFIYIDTHKSGKYGRWLVDIPCVNSTMANTWPYNP